MNKKKAKKRKMWSKEWLLCRKKLGCYENLQKELALEVRKKLIILILFIKLKFKANKKTFFSSFPMHIPLMYSQYKLICIFSIHIFLYFVIFIFFFKFLAFNLVENVKVFEDF